MSNLFSDAFGGFAVSFVGEKNKTSKVALAALFFYAS